MNGRGTGRLAFLVSPLVCLHAFACHRLPSAQVEQTALGPGDQGRFALFERFPSCGGADARVGSGSSPIYVTAGAPRTLAEKSKIERQKALELAGVSVTIDNPYLEQHEIDTSKHLYYKMRDGGELLWMCLTGEDIRQYNYTAFGNNCSPSMEEAKNVARDQATQELKRRTLGYHGSERSRNANTTRNGSTTSKSLEEGNRFWEGLLPHVHCTESKMPGSLVDMYQQPSADRCVSFQCKVRVAKVGATEPPNRPVAELGPSPKTRNEFPEVSERSGDAIWALPAKAVPGDPNSGPTSAFAGLAEGESMRGLKKALGTEISGDSRTDKRTGGTANNETGKTNWCDEHLGWCIGLAVGSVTILSGGIFVLIATGQLGQGYDK